ncbi:MAG: hypothetical protein ACTSXQ_05175 [Alphaproteobacteria bacterium]
MLKKLRLIPLLYLLAACATDYTLDERGALDLSVYEEPVRIHVSKVTVVNDYKPEGKTSEIETLMDISSVHTLKNWIKSRLKPTGKRSHRLVARIMESSLKEHVIPTEDGGFIRGKEFDYDMTIDLNLEFLDRGGYLLGVVQNRVREVITLPEDMSLEDRKTRWVDMMADVIEKLDNDLDDRIEYVFPDILADN